MFSIICNITRQWLLGICLVLLTGCISSSISYTFTNAQTPLTFTTNQKAVVLQAYVADTEIERSLGLGTVTHLTQDQAMLFIFSEQTQPAFWMKDVDYPIDIVWVQNNQVVGIEAVVPPELPNTSLADYQRYGPSQPVTWVIELPAGQAERLGMTVGTVVSI